MRFQGRRPTGFARTQKGKVTNEYGFYDFDRNQIPAIQCEARFRHQPCSRRIDRA